MTRTLKGCFMVTLTLVALLMGTSFAHALEMTAKLHYDAQHWLYLQDTLYRSFASIGGPIEVAALVAVLVLAYLVREYRTSFRLLLVAAVCLAIAFLGIWVFVTNPVNIEVRRWAAAQTIPPDWASWRSRWEYSHLARFILHLVGFVAVSFALTRMPTTKR